MPLVELDTFLITLKVPKDRPVTAIRKVLNHKSFQSELRGAIAAVLRKYTALKPLTFIMTR